MLEHMLLTGQRIYTYSVLEWTGARLLYLPLSQLNIICVCLILFCGSCRKNCNFAGWFSGSVQGLQKMKYKYSTCVVYKKMQPFLHDTLGTVYKSFYDECLYVSYTRL